MDERKTMSPQSNKPLASDEQTGSAVYHSLAHGARHRNPEAVLRAAQELSPDHTLTLEGVKRVLKKFYDGGVVTSNTKDIAKKR